MKQCIDCNKVFDDTLIACPNCGCPARLCNTVDVTPAPNTSTAPQQTAQQDTDWKQKPAPKQADYAAPVVIQKPASTDRAHYVYECAVIFWHTFTTKFAKFDGRSTRREFWSTILVPLAVDLFVPFMAGIIFIVTLIPTLAVMVRRLHDVNRSGWWCLLPFVAFFFYLQKSDGYSNNYGEPDTNLGI